MTLVGFIVKRLACNRKPERNNKYIAIAPACASALAWPTGGGVWPADECRPNGLITAILASIGVCGEGIGPGPGEVVGLSFHSCGTSSRRSSRC